MAATSEAPDTEVLLQWPDYNSRVRFVCPMGQQAERYAESGVFVKRFQKHYCKVWKANITGWKISTIELERSTLVFISWYGGIDPPWVVLGAVQFIIRPPKAAEPLYRYFADFAIIFINSYLYCNSIYLTWDCLETINFIIHHNQGFLHFCLWYQNKFESCEIILLVNW